MASPKRRKRKEQLNSYQLAKNFQSDLQKVFSAFGQHGPSEWDVIGRFSDFLQTKGHTVRPNTLYDYLHCDIFPCWLFPLCCEFLSLSPWINSSVVWEFVRTWVKPSNLLADKVKERLEEEQTKLAQKIEQLKWK